MSSGAASSQLVTHAARLVRIVSRATEREAPAGLRLLSQLDELGPVTVTELARADRSSQPTTSATVRSLEDKRLVARRPHPEDARASLLVLTEEGRAALAGARERNARVVETLLVERDVTPDQVATAVAVLAALTTPSSVPPLGS